jgi:putative heme-binding domain-containing protein
MPSGSYSAEELTGLVAFLRNIAEFDAKRVIVGDASGGSQVVEGIGQCLECHRIKGRGGSSGPDLTSIGVVRSASALQQSIIDPAAALLPAMRSLRVVTAMGEQFVARRLNEETHSVHVITKDGRLLSLGRDSLRSYEVLTKPLMPNYATRLIPTQIADVMAYLISLKQ